MGSQQSLPESPGPVPPSVPPLEPTEASRSSGRLVAQEHTGRAPRATKGQDTVSSSAFVPSHASASRPAPHLDSVPVMRSVKRSNPMRYGDLPDPSLTATLPVPPLISSSPSLPPKSAAIPSPRSEPAVSNILPHHPLTDSSAQCPTSQGLAQFPASQVAAQPTSQAPAAPCPASQTLAQHSASQASAGKSKLKFSESLQGTNTSSPVVRPPTQLPPKSPQTSKSDVMPTSTRPVDTSEHRPPSRPAKQDQRQTPNHSGRTSRGPLNSAISISVNNDRVSGPASGMTPTPEIVPASKSPTVYTFDSLPVEHAPATLSVKKFFRNTSGAATAPALSPPHSSLNAKKFCQNPGGAATPATDPVPLIPGVSAWRRTQQRKTDARSPSAVVRKVCALLNALTAEHFEEISDQLITQVNKSDGERGGETLLLVTRLVFEAGSADVRWAKQCAQLCKKMTRKVSVLAREKQNAGKHVRVVSGQLFHQRLVLLCQESCERTRTSRDQTALGAAARGQPSGPALDPGHVAQKTRQRNLGSARFVGELFRSRIISERVMQECVQKLLRVAETHPAEEEVERLCALLIAGGPSLEPPKALAYMSRLRALQKRSSLSPRARFMLLDVIEVRKPVRTTRRTTPTSGEVSLGAPIGRADGRTSTNPSQVPTRLNTNQARGVETRAFPVISMPPGPVSTVSTPDRSAEKCVPSPTTTTPSLSSSSLSSTSPSLASLPSVLSNPLDGLSVSGPSPPASASEKPAFSLPSSSPLTSPLTAAPMVNLPPGRASGPVGLQRDVAQNLRILLKGVTIGMHDHVLTEITAVTNGQCGSLTEIISLIIDAAIDEPFSSDMYALLCQKIAEQAELGQRLGGIGKPASKNVFRAQVLKQCQERLEYEWPHEGNAADGSDTPLGQTIQYSGDDAVHHGTDPGSKRRALNLIKFISELLRTQILTEHIVHDSIELLLPDVGIPSDEDIECLCDVLTNVGYLLDTPDALAQMRGYFTRMAGLTRSPHINLRMKVMLQNVIDSHGRNGFARQEPAYNHGAPALQGTETGNHSPTIRTTIHRVSPAGHNHDLGDYIRVPPIEPSRPVCTKSDSPSQARRGGMQSISTDPAQAPNISSSVPPSYQRPQSMDNSPSAMTRSQGSGFDAFPDDVECPPEYSALLDRPRQVPPVPDATTLPESNGGTDSKKAEIHLSAEVKQLFVLRDLDKGEAYLRQLPSQHHWRWVNLLVASAIASNSIPDVRLVGDLFNRVVSKTLILPDAFVTGFIPSLDTLHIVASNMPNAASLVAIMLKAAKLDPERLTGLVHQVEGSDLDMLVGLLL